MRFDKWENSFGQPYGTVLQVVSVTKTDTFSMSSTTYTDITGFAATITPSSVNSKIFVIVDGYMGSQSGQVAVRARLMRNSTPISIGNVAGSRTLASSEGISDSGNHMTPLSISFLDSPSTTSAVTYSVQMQNTGGGHATHLNRSTADTDGAGVARTASTITLMEIAQ